MESEKESVENCVGSVVPNSRAIIAELISEFFFILPMRKKYVPLLLL